MLADVASFVRNTFSFPDAARSSDPSVSAMSGYQSIPSSREGSTAENSWSVSRMPSLKITSLSNGTDHSNHDATLEELAKVVRDDRDPASNHRAMRTKPTFSAAALTPARNYHAPRRVEGNLSIQQASDNKEHFINFILKVTKGKHTPEYHELYQFLLQCFVESDTDFDGRISYEDFDVMVERAGALPRKWGFAPTSAELFPTKDQRGEYRNAQFAKVNISGSGFITFDEWLSWSYTHICEKAKLLAHVQRQSKMTSSAQDFRDFVVAAARTRHSLEYKELYQFLHDCFNQADKNKLGVINPTEFDHMIEVAAAVPRKFGFAPSSAETYRNELERRSARAQMFQKMDVDIRGHISFDAWLNFCYAHICAKAKALDPTLPSEPDTPISIQNASDDKEAFIHFILKATASRRTSEYSELHAFLLQCFIESDTDFDGRISLEDFDLMVERAGALPRKWGFAPTSAEMFPNKDQRIAFRKAVFKRINCSGTGSISFDEWLTWSYSHICEKAKLLDPARAQSKMTASAHEFRSFVVNAARSRQSVEYKELYHFLQDCFTKADQDMDGLVGLAEFDELCEIAVEAPRRFGFAPSSAQTYPSDAERLAVRAQMFQKINVKNSGAIAFGEWLDFTYAHICSNAKTLDPTLSGLPPPR